MEQSNRFFLCNCPVSRSISPYLQLSIVTLLLLFGLLFTSADSRAEVSLLQADLPEPTPLAARQAPDIAPYLQEKQLVDRSVEIVKDDHFILPYSGLAKSDSTATDVAFRADEFDAGNLNSDLWRFENPLGDSWLRLQPAGPDNGVLALHASGARSHDPWAINQAVRVMQPGPNRDFTLETKFLSTPSKRYQMQGIVVEQDAANWLRVEVQHDGAALRALVIATVDGVSVPLAQAELSGAPIGDGNYLRLIRTGDNWLYAYATDGQNWQMVASFSHSMIVTAAGLYAANHHPTDGQSPAFTALIDYFRTTDVAQRGRSSEDALDRPPFIHSITTLPETNQAVITWYTDEPTLGRVDYGPTNAYGLSAVSSNVPTYQHRVTLSALAEDAVYHLRIHAVDDGGLSNVSPDAMLKTLAAVDSTITTWYGDSQPAGQKGDPQPWFNILGEYSGSGSLSYTLNGGVSKNLTLGSDSRRLWNAGDFNVDLPVDDLQTGTNTVVITDGSENKTVIVNYQPQSAVLPYTIDWSALSTRAQIQTVAQAIDGNWILDGSTVRTGEPGYDRLIGVGDMTWQDYEVLVPFTLYSTLQNYHGVGVLIGWQGHTDEPRVCSQPKCGWMPLGALAWYRNGRLQLYSYNPDNGDNDFVEILASKSKPVTLGDKIWLRVRAESAPGGDFYSMKIWPDGTPEPAGWDVTGQAHPDALSNGSMLLITHMADASFGEVQVTPLTAGPDTVPPVITLTGPNPLELLVGSQYVEPGWTASDNVDGDLTNQVSVSGSVDTETAGSYTLSYSVADNAGNTGNVTRQVNVVSASDTTPPVIMLDGANPYTLSVGSPYNEPGWTAIDNVDGELTDQVTVSGSVNSSVPGSYTLNYSVTDAAGNVGSATRQVNVVSASDTTPPVITLNGANPYTLSVGSSYNEPSWTATDAVDGELTDQVTVSGSVDSNTVGSYVLNYSVTDSAGNTRTVTRQVNVVSASDATPPVIALNGDNPLTHILGTSYEEPGWAATDDVDGDISGQVVVTGDEIGPNTPLGIYSLLYSVMDSSGNTASAIRTVNVRLDITPPVITLNGDNPLLLIQGEAYVEPGWSAIDNVDGDISSQVNVSGTINVDTIGRYALVYAATDSSDNTDTVVRTVDVVSRVSIFLPMVRH
ncbi:MAG: DUF5011 domain-containing protein [Caldilineaceae bacterium]|nr:DUF5011 domain-containing protein [Caldilineaceae bacterium]